MLKTDSLREAMTRSCRWCQANPEKFTIFVESGNIETTGETPSFVYRYQMVMFVMDYAGSWTTSRCRCWRGYPKISHSCCSIRSVIRTSNSPPLSMTMTAPISCLRSPCGNAFALRATVRGHRRQNTCRSQNPVCPLPKATGRMYSRM